MPSSKKVSRRKDEGAPKTTLLDHFPFQLPSRGVLYDGAIPEGRVEIRKLRSREQAQINTSGGGFLRKMESIIDSVVKLPSSFDPSELLVVDRFALMIALRTRTFGPEYSFRWQCRDCRHRHMNFKVNITEELNEIPPKDGLAEPFEAELPDNGSTVGLRLLRGKDEKTILKNAQQYRMQTNDSEDPSHLYRVAVALVTKDGEEFGSILDKQDFVENQLSADDLCVIEDTIDDWEPGIDTRLCPECESCGAPNETRMPFTAEFFRPSGRHKIRRH